MNRILIVLLAFLAVLQANAQTTYEANTVPATDTKVRMSGFTEKKTDNEESVFKSIIFRSIGPTVMSGRVVDIEANPDDPTIFYAGYASGGLFKTSNNGITFEPIFDKEPTIIIGDIAVDWANNTIYIGTGENNSSRSSYAGAGIFKSTDGGKSWKHKGLQGCHRTGRIVIDPKNTNIIYVAALGSLYSSNEERGIYKSTDGGESFSKVLFINDVTGGIDIEINPANTEILYAAMWERERRAWDFRASGKNSGIYKSMNGGINWIKLEGGLPEGEGFGRCGLALSPTKPETIYALIDNNTPRDDTTKKEELKVTKDVLRKISKEDFLKLKKEDVEKYLARYNFPKEYNYEFIKEKIEDNDFKSSALVEYLEDSNNNLFETDIKGAEVYRSDDGGKTWKRTHEENLDKVFYTYGYYFANIRVSPTNPEKVYILGVPLIRSDDGGKNFISLNEDNVHVDHHGLWINPKKDGHIINGNDGGINISYDDGLNWHKANAPAVGQFYSVNYDLAKPYNVYGGLQDNGVWYGPSDNTYNTDWQNTGSYPFKSLMGGDGMQVAIDTRKNDVIYTGYQFGNYYRIVKSKNEYKYITPKHKLGNRPCRFNWQAPIQLSPFDMDVVYFGSNMLHRSTDRGDNFETISSDLTNGGKKGNVPYGTLTAISVSALKEGLIYTGSDDGLVYATKDDGEKWENISSGLPKDLWVSRITASAFRVSTVYAALNGYRWDNFEAYVYRSDNYGKNWKKIGVNLPKEPVNVIKEDTNDENILYLGTDAGLYVSLDRGNTFMPVTGNLPNVPVHDIAIHPTEDEIIAGTHGRSIYIADINPIREYRKLKTKDKIEIFSFDDVIYNPDWGNRNYYWKFNLPEPMKIPFYITKEASVNINVYTEKGIKVYEDSLGYGGGINYISYDLSVQENQREEYNKNQKGGKGKQTKDNKKQYLLPGKYYLEISDNTGISKRSFEVKTR